MFDCYCCHFLSLMLLVLLLLFILAFSVTVTAYVSFVVSLLLLLYLMFATVVSAPVVSARGGGGTDTGAVVATSLGLTTTRHFARCHAMIGSIVKLKVTLGQS